MLTHDPDFDLNRIVAARRRAHTATHLAPLLDAMLQRVHGNDSFTANDIAILELMEGAPQCSLSNNSIRNSARL